MSALEDDFVTVSEAASLLRVAPGTVRRWIRAGEVPAYRLGPRRVALRRDDVARLVTPIRPDSESGNGAPGEAGTWNDATDKAPTSEERQRRAEALAILEAMRARTAERQEHLTVRRLTDEEKREALAALERIQELNREMLAERGGEPFSPSLPIIHEMRDERLRHLTGE
jgi:excisionase family DNA binding protein